MLKAEDEHGLCLYISPLKALINDQFGRLARLCETLEISVWPWHGDIASSSKMRFFKQPSGVVLITPESLEAMLCNRGFQMPRIAARLRYIVVDELHAFIGTERGKQLQSLMLRIEQAAGRMVPRIGLSATLGDLRLGADFLRPHGGAAVDIIESHADRGALKIRIKGYLDVAPQPGEEPDDESASELSIVQHLFAKLRGSNNLIFPNSRGKVEQYTYALRRLCEAAKAPNEFWPHHGSLSREIREETEAALKNKESCATAICTNTLELGIDIGAVKSVAQIGSPPSVASMRQRLGRSGRRAGESAILRGYVIERELRIESELMDQLREGTLEFGAMVSLMLDGWIEPPKTDGWHLSTLIQQLLSLIAQHGGIQAVDAYRILCSRGPFGSIEKKDFAELLRHLGKIELLQQEASGLLLHGSKGERLVNHYTFYAAFATEDEFRIVNASRVLGSLPVSSSLSVGDYILFAGRTWVVEDINDDSKTILVGKTNTGRAPLFNGSGGHVHTKVRERMRELYQSGLPLSFMDEGAKKLMLEGCQTFQRCGLGHKPLLTIGGCVFLFTWLGDHANEAMALVLKSQGLAATAQGPAVKVDDASEQRVAACLQTFASEPPPAAALLLYKEHNLQRAKWDWALPERLLKMSFATLHLDIAQAHKWAVKHVP
jgi:ATP-dependent Lhr-like helicase